MIEEQNIPAENGESAPLWKDRVRDSTNPLGGGRQRKGDWENSVLKYIKGYTTKIGWKTNAVCKETVNAMRLMQDRYEPVRQVIDIWDAMPYKQQTRVFSLDRACDQAHVDRDEFAGLVLAAVSKHIQRNAIAIIDQSFERIIQSAVDHAITGGPRGAKERVELIKLLTRQDKPTKVAPKSESPTQGETPAEGRQAQSLDQSMAELDGIESIGVGE